MRPWRSRPFQSGFIDVVAGFGAVYIVVECKRGAGATWLFLAGKSDPKETEIAHILCTDAGVDGPDISEWWRMRLQPRSPIAHYCIVRGQGEKEPMLERLGAGHLFATESLAAKELKLAHLRRYNSYRFLVPIIVTSAQLTMCRINPMNVDYKNGRIDESLAEYETVGIVRFSKALGTGEGSAGESLEEVHRESQRTVLVINAERLLTFLDQMDLKPESPMGKWPQKIMRNRTNRRNG